MGIAKIKAGDWKAVERAINTLGGPALGPTSTPTFGGLIINGTATLSDAVIDTASVVSATISSLSFLSADGTSATVSNMGVISATVSSLACHSAIIGRADITSLSCSSGYFTELRVQSGIVISATVSALSFQSALGYTQQVTFLNASDISATRIGTISARISTLSFQSATGTSATVSNLGVISATVSSLACLSATISSLGSTSATIQHAAIQTCVVNGIDLQSTTSGAAGCERIGIPAIGSPTYTKLCDWITAFGAPGRHTGGSITAALSATVDVAAGTGFIRPTDDDTAELLSFDWAARSGISVPTNTVRYIGVDYTSGSPAITISATDNWDLDTQFSLGKIVNENGTLHVLNNPWWVTDGMTNVLERFQADGHVVRDKHVGGLAISVSSTRTIAVTSGVTWSRLNEFPITSIDTSGTDTFEYYWYDGTAWQDSAVSQYSVLQYNPAVATALVNIDNNKYCSLWVFAEADDDEIAVVYPQQQYNTAAEAEVELVPVNLPEHLTENGLLLGKIIIKQNTDAEVEVLSAFDQIFSAAAAADHGNLSGLADDDHTQYVLADGTRAVASLEVTNGMSVNTIQATKANISGLVAISAMISSIVCASATISSLAAVSVIVGTSGQLHFYNSGVTHGMTDILPTNIYGNLDADTAQGGMRVLGISSQSDRSGLLLTGVVGTTALASTIGAFQFTGAKKAGTTWTYLGDDETAMFFKNHANTLLKIYGNGKAEFQGQVVTSSLACTSATVSSARVYQATCSAINSASTKLGIAHNNPQTTLDVLGGVNARYTNGYSLGITTALPNGVAGCYHTNGATDGVMHYYSNLGDISLGSEGQFDALYIAKTTGNISCVGGLGAATISTPSLAAVSATVSSLACTSATVSSVSIENDSTIAATKKLYFDGGSNTYIYEYGADDLRIFVAGSQKMSLTNTTWNIQNANLKIDTIKSGSTQATASAVAGEVWKTSGHATLPNNVLMIGV